MARPSNRPPVVVVVEDLLVLVSKGKLDASLISGGGVGRLVVVVVVVDVVVVDGLVVGGDFVALDVNRIVVGDLVGTVCTRRIDGVVPLGLAVVLAGVATAVARQVETNNKTNEMKNSTSTTSERNRII